MSDAALDVEPPCMCTDVVQCHWHAWSHKVACRSCGRPVWVAREGQLTLDAKLCNACAREQLTLPTARAPRAKQGTLL